MLNVTLIPILKDNYAYIIQSNNKVAVIDPGESSLIIDYLEKCNLKPQFIFNTHHHWDHTDGNAEIKKKYNCTIIGPEKEKLKIPEMDKGLNHGDFFQFGDEAIEIIETPGHTLGHICFWLEDSKILFSGDALFSMGCGRLFEGTAEQMFYSLNILKKLPYDATIYCGHEYTLDNARFCLSIEPDNQGLITRMNSVKSLRNANKPTIPTDLAQEKITNVFLRAKNAEEFKKLRDLKDNF